MPVWPRSRSCSPLPKLPSDPRNPPGFHGWRPADNADHINAVAGRPEDLNASMQPVNTPGPGAILHGNRTIRARSVYTTGGQPEPPLPAPAKTPFCPRGPAGLGVIVAIASDNPFPGQDTDWIWIFNSVPRSHWMWYQRNGFSLHRENADYWTFLIPGVGEAPALSFLILVSLFAVVIGPVNYLLLGKTGRYYLLLITVPVGALLVTGGLFAYAIVTDGLGVKLRARSFTDLDQHSGRAVAWSRQSYYAAIAPSRGLTFPGDATVFPILYQPGQRFSGGERPDNRLDWDDQQNLTRGYITSRTTTQFMVLRATQSQAKLAVTRGPLGRPAARSHQRAPGRDPASHPPRQPGRLLAGQRPGRRQGHRTGTRSARRKRPSG